MRTTQTFLAGLLAMGLYGCSDEDSYRDINEPITFDFSLQEYGFEGIFSDYPQGAEEFYQLSASYTDLPEPFNDKQGFRLFGSNHSDDLFMGITGRIDGLKPATLYQVQINATLITNVPSNCFGIGGAPGESVYVKAAAYHQPIKNTLDEQNMYRLDWDIGHQSQRGEQSQVVGDIANGIDCMEPESYQQKDYATAAPIQVITDDKGEVWLLLGTDSGFEGPTEFYVQSAMVTLTK